MLSSRRERIVSFFLTLNAKNLIKETLPRALMSGAKFDVKGESIDEERNEEESARQEEKEVARAEFNPVGPEQSGPIRFWRRGNTRHGGELAIDNFTVSCVAHHSFRDG